MVISTAQKLLVGPIAKAGPADGQGRGHDAGADSRRLSGVPDGRLSTHSVHLPLFPLQNVLQPSSYKSVRVAHGMQGIARAPRRPPPVRSPPCSASARRRSPALILGSTFEPLADEFSLPRARPAMSTPPSTAGATPTPGVSEEGGQGGELSLGRLGTAKPWLGEPGPLAPRTGRNGPSDGWCRCVRSQGTDQGVHLSEGLLGTAPDLGLHEGGDL